MKNLYIIRHAKSSWDDLAIEDFDRPLNDRGMRDAPRIGKRLKEKNVTPDLMLTSPANRALTTCQHIAEILGYPKENIKTEKELYHANPEQLLKIVKSIPDKHSTALIFGHNPGITDFVNELRDDRKFIDNIPTCGVASFRCDIESWKELKFNHARLIFYDYPKNKES
jgi:phosphohistidine phosphatase